MTTRDIIRSYTFRDNTDDAEAGDGLTLEGHAAVFNTPTEIDSWEGTFTEHIRKGAFRKTLSERTPVLQFDHGHHPLIGSIPIGRIDTAKEDDTGLFVSARITDNWLTEPVRLSIEARTITGMSFRFSVVREEWRDKDGKKITDPLELEELLWIPGDRGPLDRELIELKVPELGPVVFPAYDTTDVSVRARSVAQLVIRDKQMTHNVRAALAQDMPLPTAGVPSGDDPAVRRDVACIVLFGYNELEGTAPRDTHSVPDLEDAPPSEHPSTSGNGRPRPTGDRRPADIARAEMEAFLSRRASKTDGRRQHEAHRSRA